VITFVYDPSSGIAAYAQIVRQVKHALRLGVLELGDRLPSVREVASTMIVNPNTVQKAYRELELEGLVSSRPGLGIFVVQLLPHAPDEDLRALRATLLQWLASARAAGLDDEGIEALIHATFRAAHTKEDTA
jgi:GntR family transcriptional regulator